MLRASIAFRVASAIAVSIVILGCGKRDVEARPDAYTAVTPSVSATVTCRPGCTVEHGQCGSWERGDCPGDRATAVCSTFVDDR